MTQTERLVLGLLSGVLVVGGLVWCWKPIVDAIHTVVYFLFSSGLLLAYVWWLYAKRAVRSWLAPSILLSCLLLAAYVDRRAYQRAQAVSYTRDEGWISETVYYTPTYDGEGEAIALVILGPLLGVALLWFYSTRGQRSWQFLHYFVLLLTCYPLAALSVFFLDTKPKPKYYEGSYLPATVADSLRLVRRNMPYEIYSTER